jgi:hypothetical protein
MRERPDLRRVSDDQLLRGLFDVLKRTRHNETDVVAHIAEVDARKLYAREASPSMFAYCTEVLHLSEPEAALRIRVARASRKHPMLLTMLSEGRIHLSGIALLAPLLTRKNRVALLKRATHKSKRQIEEMVAEFRPAPAAPPLVRRLPNRRHEGSPALAHGAEFDAGGMLDHRSNVSAQRPNPSKPVSPQDTRTWTPQQRPDAVALVNHSKIEACGGEPRPNAAAHASPHLALGRLQSPPPARLATVAPVAPARFRVRFDASAELRDKLERLQALMRSSVPDGDLGKVIELAITRELERLEARRFAKTKKPRTRVARADTTPKSRYVPAAVRRFVEKRDGGRCAYRDRHGRRCTRRHDLEFHHRRPFGLGGDHSPEGLALMCHTHNALLAEADFGKEKMARYRRRARRDMKMAEVTGTESANGGLRAQWRSTG